jgi:hypothetical protein
VCACVCVCVCVCARARGSVHACACVRVRLCAFIFMCERARVFVNIVKIYFKFISVSFWGLGTCGFIPQC